MSDTEDPHPTKPARGFTRRRMIRLALLVVLSVAAYTCVPARVLVASLSLRSRDGLRTAKRGDAVRRHSSDRLSFGAFLRTGRRPCLCLFIDSRRLRLAARSELADEPMAGALLLLCCSTLFALAGFEAGGLPGGRGSTGARICRLSQPRQSQTWRAMGRKTQDFPADSRARTRWPRARVGHCGSW